MTLSEYVRSKRTDRGISRNQLAISAGISHTEVHRIETGERKQPSLKVLCALADALAVPQEEILRVAGYASRRRFRNGAGIPQFEDVKAEGDRREDRGRSLP